MKELATIREMKVDDLDAVFALERAAFQAPHWTRADYASILDQEASAKRTCFIAEIDGRLVGTAVLRVLPVTGGESTADLESIAVDVEARGKGLGAMLTRAVFDRAVTQGAARLELEVRASNQSAISLYRRFGMEVEGLRRNYYSNPVEDALLMGKNLR